MKGKETIYKHTFAVHNKRAAEIVLPILFSFVKPASLLDVGCGLGSWLSVANEMGTHDFLGVDGEHVDFNKLFIPADRLKIHDLTRPLDLKRQYDLVICLEVAEHLPEAAAETLINTLTLHSQIILFSAAMPGQGGQNHLNEKRLSYWIALFAKHDYHFYDVIRHQIWNHSEVDVWYRQNAVIFCKKGHPAESLLLSRSSPFVDIIHPELFEFHSYQAARAALYEEGKLGMRTSIFSLWKSLLNKFR